MDMEKTNAVTPRTASGFPNVGLFVGFNLPVYRDKYRAGVCEAQERALADAKLYEAQRDETCSEIQDFMTQARVQQDVLALLRDSILPRTKETLELARSDYSQGQRRLRDGPVGPAGGAPGPAPDRPGRGGAGQGPGVAGAGRRLPDQRAPARARHAPRPHAPLPPRHVRPFRPAPAVPEARPGGPPVR